MNLQPIPKDTGSFLPIRNAWPNFGHAGTHAPAKPVWLIGLSFERDVRKFLEGVYERMGGVA